MPPTILAVHHGFSKLILNNLPMKKRSFKWMKYCVAIIATIILIATEANSQSQTFDNPANNGITNKWTAPPGVTSITVECWGAGGAGGGSLSNNRSGGGGGGGAYKKEVLVSVTPGVTYDIIVGAGGIGSTGNGTNGSASFATFDGFFVVSASGGTGATGAASNINGVGGIGAVGGTYSGGSGFNGANGAGGGGGSSAGTSLAGVSATSNLGAIAPSGGGNGGNGATGGADGLNGNLPGGGGGGGRNMGGSGNKSGGAGGNGQVIISWICPTGTISYSGTPFCKSISTPQSVSFTGTTGGSFSATPSGLTIDATTGSITPSNSLAGTYTVHYQIAAGGSCPAVDATTSITVTPLVNPGTLSGASPLCIGNTSNYTTNGDAGGTWSSTNLAVATVDPTSGVVTVVGQGTTDITYSISSGCGSPLSSFKTLTINPNANAGVVTGTSTLCIGGVHTFTSNGDPGGTWSSTNMAVATVDASGEVTALAEGSTNITYTINSGCNIPVSSFKSLTVNPDANAGTVSGSSPLCIGATNTFTTDGDAGGTWTSTDPSVATVDPSSGLVTALSAGTTDIKYTISTGCNSPVTALKTLTVNPDADAGTVSGTSPICIGQTTTYSSDGDAGGTWSSTDPTVASVNASSGLVTALAAGNTDITYTVNSGCGSPVSFFKTLTVSPNANAGTISGTSPLCVNETNTFTSNGDAGGTWSSTNPAVASVNTAGLVTALTAGSTNITYTVSDGCNVPVSSFKALTVYDLPNNVSGGFTGSTICAGETGSLTFNANDGSFVVPYTISYTDGTTTWNKVISSASATTFDVEVSPLSTTTYTLLSITNGNGCTRTTAFADATASITVNALPNNVSGGFTGETICEGEPGQLSFDALNASFVAPYSISYTDGITTWNQVISSADATSFNVAVDPTTTTTYTLSGITNGNGCTRTSGFADATAQIVVNPKPACIITGTEGPVCPSSSNNYSAPAGMSSYQWTLTTANGAVFSTATNLQNVTVTAGSGCNTSYILSLTITNGNGCISTCEKVVSVKDETDPTWTVEPANLTVECNGTGNAAQLAAWLASFSGTRNWPHGSRVSQVRTPAVQPA
jgi:trimeric autotransporter adhesin